MKRKDLLDLRNKSSAELTKLAGERKSQANKKKMEIVSGKNKNLREYKNLRRELAKILTLASEKKIIEKIEVEKAKEEKAKTKK